MKEASNLRESRISHGRLVAQLLAGSWGSSTLSNSAEDLRQIADLITACGAGGLGWGKVRSSGLRSSHIGELFQAQYRFQSIQAALHERRLKKVIPFLRRAGVEPLLVKGWATARLYPQLGMRPYLDLDLCVLPEQYKQAHEFLKSGECDDCRVDLHLGFGKFYDRRTDEVFERSRLVNLDELEIRVLGREDDLRFLCLHLLRHGAVQPLWLCDVALLLEKCTAGFDWDRCLAGSRRVADWVGCTLGLAHHLLGANVEGTPVEHRARRLPSWLLSTVLEQWGRPFKSLPQMVVYLRDPRRWIQDLPKELSRHWPNPIEATMTLGGSFNRLPRLPFQIGHVLSRTLAMFSNLLPGLGNGVLNRS